MIGGAIYSILENNLFVASVLNIDSNLQVYPIKAEQRRALPYVTYQVISDEPENTRDFPAEVRYIRVQLNIHHSIYDRADNLAGYIYDALNDYSGTIKGVNIDHAYMESQLDDPGDADHYIISADYIFRIKV